jgi:hypothetical protein
MPNNSSNVFRGVPNDSEEFGKVPHNSEGFRIVRNDSEPSQNHTLTVRDVARLFERSGVARTERSITNWCRPNKTGIPRLDATFDQNERKYFITPQSVERAIQEELARDKNKQANGASAGTSAEAGIASTNEIKVFEQEIRDLKIASGVKDKFIDLLKSERAEFAHERQSYIEQLTQSSRQIGELESKLRQIEAPSAN